MSIRAVSSRGLSPTRWVFPNGTSGRMNAMFFRHLALLLASGLICSGADQQFADLGDLELENGEVIQNCRIGYRTYGILNADRSNTVLFPTWISGNTSGLEPRIGPDKLADSSKYFVVSVDALGNGVSCSPSNSATQKNGDFPFFGIRDMVRSQHRLVKEVLKIEKLHAVLGISMGGFHTFEWIVSYPEMMTKAIPIVGTTNLTSVDLLLWRAELGIIEAAQNSNGDRVEAMRNVGRIDSFALRIPAFHVRETPVSEFAATLGKRIDEFGERNDYDYAAQLRALIDHDISRHFDNSMEAAAEAVKADVLIIVAAQDHMVNPQPATDFARLLGLPILILQGDCGHHAFLCESELVESSVRRFVDQ